MKQVQHIMRDPDPAIYLEVSPYEGDGGHLIGRLPGSLQVSDLKALRRPVSPIKAIRAKCLDCCAGSQAEVRKCVSINCPLWSMRMGVNPFYGNRAGSENKPASLEASR